jgi:aminopeptidase N
MNILSVLLFSCATLTAFSDLALSRDSSKGLSQVDAERRSQTVANVRYDLSFTLSDSDMTEDFLGTSTIRFEVLNPKQKVTLDFNGGKIHELTVNGKKQTTINYNTYFLTLPDLPSGPNEVVINFSHPYSKTGAGFYRFKDPEDKNFYMYTDFEPFEANELFPAFDQPDLKATYTFSVKAPKAWIVVTSVRESSKSPQSDGQLLWKFPESAKYSTYITSLMAGPYKVWEDKAGNIPLRLLARQSLAKYVAHKEWFMITKQGFKFFNEYFDYPYPFLKYDQIIVPDFNAGAMENVAAVTFSERFVSRGAMTNSERESRANVILHEMAHMWFGNLVTMKWWNDLWLNESFATYMATLANAESTEFKKAWQTFYTGTKQWAYWEDQLVTTHPIEGQVPHTEQAFANFDGITYGKGASVLKSLSYYIGANNFRDGLRSYFKTHAYKNTDLKDFMSSLEQSSKKDLSQWTKDWLQTAGLNTVEAKFTCANGKVSLFSLEQTAPKDHPTLRSHRTKVALFQKMPQGFKLISAQDVDYQGASTQVASLQNQTCPDLVYPNYEDYDFVKVRLDPKTLATAKAHLAQIQDPLLRSMFWTALWDSVRDAEWPVTSYVETVFDNLAAETDTKITEKVLETLYGKRRNSASVLLYLPGNVARHSFNTTAEKFAYDALQKQKPGSDAQKIWFNAYIRLVRTDDGVLKLSQYLDGSKKVPGLPIDQDRRWEIIAQLSEIGAPNAKDLRVAESKKDQSNQGKQSAISAEVLIPDKNVKTNWYNTIVSDQTKLSLAEVRTAMGSMFPVSQISLSKDFADLYFKNLPELSKTKKNEYIGRFAANMAPAYCEPESAQNLQKFVKKHKELPPIVLKGVKVATQEDERCLKIRTLVKQ